MDYQLSLGNGTAARILAILFPKRIKTKGALEALIKTLGDQQANNFTPYEQFIWLHNVHIWVYRCTQVIANAGIRATPKQYREWYKGGILKREQLPPDHPASKILNDPNPNDTMEDILEKLWVSLCLSGIFYFYIDKDNLQLNHLRSDRVTILPDPKRFISKFIYELPGVAPIPFDRDEVLWGKYYNPNNDFYGLSPLAAASNSIESHLKAQKWNLNFFNNSAVPLAILKTEYDFANNPELLKQIKAEWNDLYQGYENFGKIGVTGGGTELKTIVPTHEDMNFIQLLDKARDEIASAFGVPPIFLNDQEKANYANMREYERQLWRSEMIPKLLRVQAWFNKHLNVRFAEGKERIITIFDLSQVEALQEDIQKEAEASRTLVLSGQRWIDEARARRGEPPLPNGEGEQTLIPMSFIPLGMAGQIPGAALPPDPSAKHAKMKMAGARNKLLPGREERVAHWEETKKIVLSNEARLKKLMVALFTDWAETMQANLRGRKAFKADFTVEDILFDLAGAEEYAGAAGEPIFKDSMRKGGDRALSLTGVSLNFDMENPRVLELLATKVQRFKERIPSAAWNRMKESLSEGIQGSETIEELSRRVEEWMGREINNAETIARTEVLPCYHQGQQEGMKQSGVVELKEWMSAFAPLTREEHADADGQKVALDDFFVVDGEALEYPGDSRGSASNIINCLCDMIPSIAEAEEGGTE